MSGPCAAARSGSPPTATGDPPTGTQELPAPPGLPPTGTQDPPASPELPPTGTGDPPTGTQDPPASAGRPPTDSREPRAGPAAPPGPHRCAPSLPEDYELAGKNKVVTVDGVRVKLQIWDTAGQERFRSVTHAYYRDAQALLLLYDITSKLSFDNIRAWLSEIHEYAQKDVVIMLLGNKADVSGERAVRTEDGASLAREYGVPFMETSAKTGMNVELAFLAVARELKQRAVQEPAEPRFQIHDYIESQKKKSSCCSFA
ncbi:ras-related protein Rab-37 isoform X2 [Struthio camelus]|uniref:ras-related protein Rab-37 isoform X2 n=1 Tax=Struthio camelus TaxID=8801 RepID=UPI003603F194